MEDGIVATHDERVLIEAIKSGSNGVEVAKRFDSFASSWKDKFHLEALAKCSDELVKACGKENAGIEALCSFCFKLANRGEKTLFSAVFGSELMRSLLLSSMESGVGRKDASGAFVRLCLFCLKDKSVDVVVASFVRFLVIPVRRLLQDRASDLQSLANAAQIVAARCASQSFDKMREPDEVVLFAEAGVFDELGARLEIEALHGPIMNAIQGLMTSPAALEKVDPKGKMMERLKILRSSNKQASSIVDAVELVDFKRVVKEKAKEKGGQALGNEFLGVLGAAGGPQQLGFEFTNKDIEKGFKDLAFKEGVLKPMAQKMEEEGEEPINVDNIARSVLNDFTKPKPGCEMCGAEGTKRCGACKSAFYCSEAHQRQHWAQHKNACKK